MSRLNQGIVSFLSFAALTACSPHSGSSRQTRCREYQRQNGVLLTSDGPIGPERQDRHYPTRRAQFEEITTGLDANCADSSSAQFERALLLRRLNAPVASREALSRAISLDSDWTPEARAAAQAAQAAMKNAPTRTQQAEATANDMGDGDMDIPGVGDGGGDIFGGGSTIDIYSTPGAGDIDPTITQAIGDTGSTSTSYVGDWVPGVVAGVVDPGLGALATWLGTVICYSSGCFKGVPMPPPDQGVKWVPVPRGFTGDIPPYKVIMFKPKVVSVDSGPGSTLKLKLFPALALPPVDGMSSVEFIPDAHVHSCNEYLAGLPNLEIGTTNINIITQRLKEFRRSANGQTCMWWRGWDSFEYRVASTCRPFVPATPATSGCTLALSQFNEACARHEAQHQRDIRKALGNGNGPALAVRICVNYANPTDAQINELSAAFKAEVDKKLAEVINAALKKLHQTPEGTALDPISYPGFRDSVCALCFPSLQTNSVSGPDGSTIAEPADQQLVEVSTPPPQEEATSDRPP